MSSMLYIASQNQIELDNRTQMTLSCPEVIYLLNKEEPVVDLSLVTYCSLYCGLCAEHRSIPRIGPEE